MIELIPREIIGEIFKNFSLKELIKNEIVCKSFRNIIRSTKWKLGIGMDASIHSDPKFIPQGEPICG
jgi:hypothetical protein